MESKTETGANMILTPQSHFSSKQPITSPLRNSAPMPTAISSNIELSPPTKEMEMIMPESDFIPDEESVHIYNYWMPSTATSQILQGVAAASGSPFYPDRASLTMPGRNTIRISSSVHDCISFQNFIKSPD